MSGIWLLYLYIYNSSVSVYVTELLSNDWTDFDEIFCVFSRGSENGLDSQFFPLDIVFCIDFQFISSFLYIFLI